MHKLHVSLLGAVLLTMSGCMFDIVSVPQKPTVFTKLIGSANTFTVDATHLISTGTGFQSQVKAGTTWIQIGSISEGDVYHSADQVLVVEASNMHEAALVVKDGVVTGFFLVVEKTFCPAKQPIPIK